MFRLISTRSVILAAACAVSSGLVPTASAELLRVPSSCAQFWGYGYGAGYHAPKVRAVRPCPPHVQRRVVAPTYPHCNVGSPPMPCAPAAPLPTEPEAPLKEVPAVESEAVVPTGPVSDAELGETAISFPPVLPPPSMLATPSVDPLFRPPLPFAH